ncbi:MAG: hypothetical protein ACM338_00495 [Betaproteobacteria bacterium]
MAGTRRLPRTVARQVGGKPRDALLEPKVTRLSLGAAEKEQRCAATALGIDAIEALAAEEAKPSAPSRDGALTTLGLAIAVVADRPHVLPMTWTQTYDPLHVFPSAVPHGSTIGR